MAKFGSMAVGSIVELSVGGTPREFIVVHQGNPNSSTYDSSCDGTWLMMKDIYTTGYWDGSNNDYANSDVHSYLNNTFIGLLDSNVQSAVKEVKIPYTSGTGSGSLATGASGLTSKAFLLSMAETGATSSYAANSEGVALDYFNGAANSKRIAYYNSTANAWWTRSPSTGTTYIVLIGTAGSATRNSLYSANGIRPAFVLPSSFDPEAPTMGDKAVGEKVTLNVNGTPYDFIVVQQGNPDSSIYDSSCNGTWLLSQYLYTSMPFDSTNNDYANSDIHAYLNSTFISLLDSDVQSAIKQVKIPYTNGAGNVGTVANGANGLSTKVFLPSYAEMDFSDSDSNFPIYEGKALEYFAGADFKTKRGCVKGSYDYYSWWLRTSYKGYPNYVHLVGSSGSNGGSLVTSTSNYIRPMFILPSWFPIAAGSAIKGSVNIGGTWKELSGGHVNIGGVWKEICGSYVNIGGTWKQTF